MYPPPPRLPANGHRTARANPVATAASTALPPARMISSPAALAGELLLATIEVGANVPCSPGLKRHSLGNVTVWCGSVTAARSLISAVRLPVVEFEARQAAPIAAPSTIKADRAERPREIVDIAAPDSTLRRVECLPSFARSR